MSGKQVLKNRALSLRKLTIFIILGISFHTMMLTQSHAKEKPHQQRILKMPLNNPNFVGRKLELLHIHEALTAGPSHLFVVGLSGVGKTQLVRKYTQDHIDEYDLVWWFDASLSLQAQYSELAKALNRGILEGDNQIPEATIAGPYIMEAVHDKLPEISDRCLLIFDDINNPEEVTQSLGGASHAIFITNRDLDLGESIQITELAREDSIQILGTFFADDRYERTSLDALAETMGDLPASLVFAAGYIQNIPSMTIEAYVDLFNENQTLFVRLGEQVISSSEEMRRLKPFDFSLKLSLEELAKSSPVSYQCLKFLSCLSSQNITEDLIEEWLGFNGLDTALLHEITLNLTSRFYLTQVYSDPEKIYETHQLVQRTVRLLNTDDVDYLRSTEAFFVQYLNQDTLSVSDLFSRKKFLFQHIKCFYNTSESLVSLSSSFKVHLMHAAQNYGVDTSLSAYIQNSLEEAVESGRHDLEPFELARFLNTKGKLIFAQKLNLAIAETIESIELLKACEGDSRVQPELFLAGVNNLTDYYQIQGRLAEAQASCHELQEIAEGIKNPIYATVYHSFVALNFLYEGNYQEALASINESYRVILENGLSENLFVFVLVNKAEILARMAESPEELVQAQEFLEFLKTKIKEIFRDRPNHLSLRTNMVEGLLFLKAGNLDQAESILKEALQQYEALVASNAADPIQAFAHITLAQVDIQKENYEGAIKELKAGEHVLDTVLITKELDDLSAVYQYMTITAAQTGNLELAREYLGKQVDAFGQDHPRTLNIVAYFDLNGLPVPW